MAVNQQRYNELKNKQYSKSPVTRSYISRGHRRSFERSNYRARILDENARIHKELPIYRDSVVSRQVANADAMSARQVRRDASVNSRTMTSEERSAYKSYYYRQQRKAQGLSAG